MKVATGPESIDRDQSPLSAEEADLVARFHDLLYRKWVSGSDTLWINWLGFKLAKCPLDLWIYQELLVRTRPDLVIEAGTFMGGSALYMATVMDLIGHGRIISIDTEPREGRPEHPRLTYWTGSSVDPQIVREAQKAATGGRTMVVLDSDHSADHVFAEMIAYRALVQVGDYLIVEDTNINGHPTYRDFGPGPMEAVERFLAETDEFVSDRRCERFLMTLNPKGYLKRVRSATPGSRSAV
jgi:cephalosporin hydroxylase